MLHPMPHLIIAGEGIEPTSGDGEIVTYGPGDVRRRTEYPEVSASGRGG